MKTIVNHQVLEVPTAADGSIDADSLRLLARIPSNRALVLQQADGGNRIVNPGEKLSLRPDTAFIDAPLHTRG
ncbi:MAG: hypothetical protein AMXMBFR47_35810 [Planctomycetota bacterium]